MRETINLKDLPKGGPYSHAVECCGLIFVSGQTATLNDRYTTFEEQFNNAIEKITQILQSSNSSLKDVLKVTVYLDDKKYFEEMNSLFKKSFNDKPPARTTLVTGFVVPGVLVEIDVIACKYS